MEMEMGIEMGALGLEMEHWREKDEIKNFPTL